MYHVHSFPSCLYKASNGFLNQLLSTFPGVTKVGNGTTEESSKCTWYTVFILLFTSCPLNFPIIREIGTLWVLFLELSTRYDWMSICAVVQYGRILDRVCIEFGELHTNESKVLHYWTSNNQFIYTLTNFPDQGTGLQ